ncbi:MAG: RNA polymerase sigma factor [Lachnospiraceae bacterium]|nr:RNA polymerase sigma factor [Lachnospiraceae bacterium]
MHLNIFEELIEKHGKDIYSFCVYLTRNKNDAEDLYQQTFLTAMEKDEMDKVRNLKSYFIAIAVNLWNNQKRKFLWRKKKADIVYFQDDYLDQLADHAQTVEEQVLRQEEIETVRRCVVELPDKMRIVIILYYKENMTVDEIAAVLKIPSGTVKSRMHQAKNKIKERLMNDGR